jgi:hypothetical protein
MSNPLIEDHAHDAMRIRETLAIGYTVGKQSNGS